MAKGARASSKKRNHANLRKKVFAPTYDARTERLSAKLQEIANAPKPEQEKKMDVDSDKVDNVDTENAATDAPGMPLLRTVVKYLLSIHRRNDAMDRPNFQSQVKIQEICEPNQ